MFDGVKVFTASKQKDREELGEVITRWVGRNSAEIEIVDKVVTQSSDSEYHCISVSIFYTKK